MRAAVAGLLLLPLLAGCSSEPVQDVSLEAFVATYEVTPLGTNDRYDVNVTFGDVIDYVDADGRVYEGYAVEVDYGARAERSCSGQSVLGLQFELRRSKWGNGWDQDRRCVHEQVDWVARELPWPRVQHFGIGLHGGQVREAWTTEGTFMFDGLLAPLEQVKDGSVVARRVAYHPTGPLVALTRPASPWIGPLANDVRPLGGPSPSGFQGADEDLPHGFAFDDAVAYLQANNEEAATRMAAGACIRSFHISGPFETTPPDAPVWTASQAETHLTIELADADDSTVFALDFGPTAPFGERSFFGAREDDGPGFGSLDCSLPRRSAPLDAQFRLIQDRVPGIPMFTYGIWQKTPEDQWPWFQLVADTDQGRIEVHGTAGLLQSWHVPRGTSIDP